MWSHKSHQTKITIDKTRKKLYKRWCCPTLLKAPYWNITCPYKEERLWHSSLNPTDRLTLAENFPQVHSYETKMSYGKQLCPFKYFYLFAVLCVPPTHSKTITNGYEQVTLLAKLKSRGVLPWWGAIPRNNIMSCCVFCKHFWHLTKSCELLLFCVTENKCSLFIQIL